MIYSPDGVVLKKTFPEVSNPVKSDGSGPIGDFWRVWRGAIANLGEDVISIAVKGRSEDLKINFLSI